MSSNNSLAAQLKELRDMVTQLQTEVQDLKEEISQLKESKTGSQVQHQNGLNVAALLTPEEAEEINLRIIQPILATTPEHEQKLPKKSEKTKSIKTQTIFTPESTLSMRELSPNFCPRTRINQGLDLSVIIKERTRSQSNII